jgi:hypothetical protein
VETSCSTVPFLKEIYVSNDHADARSEEEEMTDYIAAARRLLSPHFATDGEEDGPEAERICQAVETLLGSIAEALSVEREEGRQEAVQRCIAVCEVSVWGADNLARAKAALAQLLTEHAQNSDKTPVRRPKK